MTKKGAILTFASWVKYIFPEWSGYNGIRRVMTDIVTFVSTTIAEILPGMKTDENEFHNLQKNKSSYLSVIYT